MPRRTRSVPSYRQHRASGQAVVTLCGRDFYLGPHGTQASKLEYDRLVGKWLQQGRQAGRQLTGGNSEPGELFVIQLIVAYLRFAKPYYRKNGRPTSEFPAIVHALRYVQRLYGRKPVSQFGPLALQTVIQQMIQAGWARGTINKQAGRIKRMFRWGVSQELIPTHISDALASVAGLRKGRTEAKETRPIMPVDDATVAATLNHLPEIIADMVRLQRLTGMRPAEVCMLRPTDLDRRDEVWIYRPESHKTQHRGRERAIFIGPQAQRLLLKYLAREPSTYCFRPLDSEAKRRAAQHAARKTPLQFGNRPGTNRQAQPKKHPGDKYDTNSYRRAIHRACDLAFPHRTLAKLNEQELTELQQRELRAWKSQNRWSPNALRHTAATEIRRQFGLEAAQIALGHAHADVTEVYAERDRAKGIEIARMIG